MSSWPDRCRGFFIVRAAALLLVSSVTLHRFSPRSVPSAYAIAANVKPTEDFENSFPPRHTRFLSQRPTQNALI